MQSDSPELPSTFTLQSLNKSEKLLLFLLAGVWLFRLLTLGAYPLFDTTEGRYAEVARDVAYGSHWVMPELAGRPFWAKPPLAFWAIAVSYKVLGQNEFATRLPAYLFSLITMGMTFLLANRFFGRKLALWAALILSSFGLFFAMSAGVLTDPALAMATTGALVSFAFFAMQPGDRRWHWGLSLFAFLGIGLLAKGLVALILPGLTIALWALYTRQLKTVLRLPWFSGLAVMLLISVPWHVMAELKSPGFLDYYIVGEHFKRFVVKDWGGDLYGDAHEHMKGTIWLYWVIGLMPWLILVPFSLLKLGRKTGDFFHNPMNLFLLSWTLAPAIFFTMAGNILSTYILPALPGAAILIARLLMAARETATEQTAAPAPWFLRRQGLVAMALFVPVLGNLACIFVLPRVGDYRSQRELARAVMRESENENYELVYFDDMPYSGFFYTNGRAEGISDKSRDEVLHEMIPDDHRDYFAVEYNGPDLSEFESIGILPQLHLMGTFGKYKLYKETAPVLSSGSGSHYHPKT